MRSSTRRRGIGLPLILGIVAAIAIGYGAIHAFFTLRRTQHSDAPSTSTFPAASVLAPRAPGPAAPAPVDADRDAAELKAARGALQAAAASGDPVAIEAARARLAVAEAAAR